MDADLTTWREAIWAWTVHAALAATVITGAGVVAIRACREPVHRVRIAMLTLLATLLAPWLHAIPVIPRWSLPWLPASDGGPTTASVPEPGPTADEAAVRPSVDFRSPALEAPPGTERTALDVAATSSADTARGNHRHATAARATSARPSVVDALKSTVVVGYLAIALASLGWWLLGVLMLARLRRSAGPVPAAVAEAFESIARGGRSRVRVLESRRVETPVAFWWRRPIILLPSAVCRGGDPRAVRFGLAHEWAHIRHRDLWAWPVGTLAQVLFFYLPTYWWLRRQLRLDQDILADARAVAEEDASADYAEYLVRSARARLVRRGWAPAVVGLFSHRSHLARRIAMLVASPRPPRLSCRPLWGLAIAAGTLVVVAAAGAIRLDAAPGPRIAPGPSPSAEVQDPPADEPVEKGRPAEAQKGERLEYEGEVVEHETGKPIPGATVTVRRMILKAGERRVVEETRHETDAGGKYRFAIPPEQSSIRWLYIELDVEAPEHAPRRGFGYALSMIRKNERLGERPFFEHVELMPGEAIGGTVQLPDGTPARGIKVMSFSMPSPRDFNFGSFADTRTDADGKFRLMLTKSAPGALWILPEDYAPEGHEVKPDRRGDLGHFVLEPGAVMRGRVVDVEGRPVAGAFVEADHTGNPGVPPDLPVANQISRVAVTDQDGRFALKPLPPGTYAVLPKEEAFDPTLDRGQWPDPRPLDSVFVRQEVTIKEDREPEPIEVRATPHVVLSVQFLDSKGKPRSGHEPHVFGRYDGQFWFTSFRPAGEGQVGKFALRAPHGLEEARVELMTNEHGSLRHRMAPDQPLQGGREIDLGTLERDYTGIQVVRYEAPILLVKVTNPAGEVIKPDAVGAKYVEAEGKFPAFVAGAGESSDVSFEKQNDGRHRSSQLLPDSPVKAFAVVDGRRVESEPLSLAEGEEREVTLKVADDAGGDDPGSKDSDPKE